MKLSNIHFLKWNIDIKNELKKEIIRRLFTYLNVEEKYIKDILVTGSRVYYIDEKINCFKENSDLDIAIYLEEKCYNNNFLNINPLKIKNLNKINIKQYMKFIPCLRGFNFYDVKCSCFIFKEKKEYIIYNIYNNKWNLPYYSLLKHFYYFGNKLHLIDYIINMKRRIDKYKYCIICDEMKDANIQFNFDVLTEEMRLEDEKIKKYRFCICEECFNKLFFNKIENFIKCLKFCNK